MHISILNIYSGEQPDTKQGYLHLLSDFNVLRNYFQKWVDLKYGS
jgi:hypothetical protein